MFQGLPEGGYSLSIVLFLSSCFWTVLRYGWHLHIQSERWRSSMETGGHDDDDDDDDAGETEESSCEFEELEMIFFFFCSVWNVKVCLDWNGHSDLFSSAFWTHSSSDWTTSVSHRNSYVYETTTASRQTNNPKHWDLLPFHLPCLPSSCYPA